MRTKENMMEYFSGGERSYKDYNNGSSLFNTKGDGLIRLYALLNKADKKRLDELADTLKNELNNHTNPSEDYLSNQYYLFDAYAKNLYIQKKYDEMKTKYNKLVKLADGLKVVIDGSYK